ncbi:FMN-dependent dehydrogenase [Kalaharituber pfeilii]|nr:FMN-dependent dehydrogenase [Kalaharituber pfeilii]
MSSNYHNILSIDDLERAATDKMDRMTRGYFNSGADGMVTLRDNINSFDKYKLRPRILRDVLKIDSSTEFMGRKIAFPLGIAPTAMQKLAHPDGELATARAAAKRDVPMALSSFSTTPLEKVVEAAGDKIDHVLQLYVMQNRKTSELLVKRAEKAGYKAIFLTVDTPYLGRRFSEVRSNFALPSHLSLGNFTVSNIESTPNRGGGGNASLCWKDVAWLKSITKMQVWLKGVMTEEDTLLAIEHGADGIIVSNHGGRQLDSATSTLDALPECVAAAKGRIPVHIDGGIRRGTDIFKALALGAGTVWIGRIPIWGLVYNGQAGVDLALKILYEEFVLCMGLAGCRTVKEISRSHLARVMPDGRLAKL